MRSALSMLHRVHKLFGILVLSLVISPPLLPQTEQQPPLGQPSNAHEHPKDNHKTDKDNLNAIGTRRVDGTGAGNWYSLESEIRMGREYSAILETHVKLVDDPEVNEYVNRVGQNLVRNSDAKVAFTFKVIDSDEVNAFSLPGGFLYVNSGLILASDDEAQLAGAMAHEIAHIAARHATRQMTRSNLIGLLTLPLVLVGGPAGLAVQEAVSVAKPIAFSKFSRTFEIEADYLGMEYMYQAGYDPEGLIAFFEKVEAGESKKPGTLSKIFASHPQTADRVRKSQAEIAGVLPAREQYVITTSDFDMVKAQLSELENRRKRLKGEGDRPVLKRRTPMSAEDDIQNPSDGDDRPVLKRRVQNQ